MQLLMNLPSWPAKGIGSVFVRTNASRGKVPRRGSGDSWLVWQGAFEFDTEEVELGIGEVFSGVQTFRADADHACG